MLFDSASFPFFRNAGQGQEYHSDLVVLLIILFTVGRKYRPTSLKISYNTLDNAFNNLIGYIK